MLYKPLYLDCDYFHPDLNNVVVFYIYIFSIQNQNWKVYIDFEHLIVSVCNV